MEEHFNVHKDIRIAETLPADFYRSQNVFDTIRETIFLKTWQWIGDESLVPFGQYVHPFIFMDNYISEPLVLVRDKDDSVKCFFR